MSQSTVDSLDIHGPNEDSANRNRQTVSVETTNRGETLSNLQPGTRTLRQNEETAGQESDAVYCDILGNVNQDSLTTLTTGQIATITNEVHMTRPRLLEETCCNCTRHSTCGTSRCACRLNNRSCSNCACYGMRTTYRRGCTNMGTMDRPQSAEANIDDPFHDEQTPNENTPQAAFNLPIPLATNATIARQSDEQIDEIEEVGIVDTQENNGTGNSVNLQEVPAEVPPTVQNDRSGVNQQTVRNGRCGENPVAAQEVLHHSPIPTSLEQLTRDPNADLIGFIEKEAHRQLRQVYGDHLHDNDGSHLHGNLSEEEDLKWQDWWKVLVASPLSSYALPKGATGKKFLRLLTQEFQNVRVHRTTNAERIIVFIAVILERSKTVKKASDIKRRLEQRMLMWEEKKFKALFDDTVGEKLSRRTGIKRPTDDEKARRFHNKMLSGRPRQAVRHLTNRDTGGVLNPEDLDSKTNLIVVEVLRAKHPEQRIPEIEDLEHSAFEEYPNVPDVVPLCVSADAIAITVTKLNGGAGPSGIDSTDLKNWLIRFGLQSEGLRTELAKWTEWMANGDPPYSSIRALMAGRLVALDKQPGVRPIGIGEVFRRLMAKTVIRLTGHQATMACDNLNLCAGLQSGIEGAVHAIANKVNSMADTFDCSISSDELYVTESSSDDETLGGNMRRGVGWTAAPNTNDSDSSDSETEGTIDPEAVLLVDARNGFNELNRFAMLWTVRHLWPAGARFAFQCYRHASILILRRGASRPCLTILSREGVTQGDPLSMILYGITLVPLAKQIRAQTKELVQPWYADNMAMAGTAEDIGKAMSILLKYGPDRGYFPESEKSILVCNSRSEEKCRQILRNFDFTYTTGNRYLGGFIGDNSNIEQWIKPMIDKWVQSIRDLAKVAVKYPQTAYAGLCKSLQMEWQYLQRVVPDTGKYFGPIETAIKDDFLPALLGEEGPISDELRLITTLATKAAGIALYDPTRTALFNYEASIKITQPLATSLEGNTVLNIAEYQTYAASERNAAKGTRFRDDLEIFQTISAKEKIKEKRRLERAKSTGLWLTVMPMTLNGTDLSRDEFRDNIRIRLGMPVKGIETTCDGCGKPFSLTHSQSCHTGGLVTIRHDDLKEEFMDLCSQALRPSKVRGEPLINTYRGDATEEENTAERSIELRGDIAAHGFWNRGRSTIFDVRICDTDAKSYSGNDPKKVMAQLERNKRTKYEAACQLRRCDFTPLVFSIDGLMGDSATSASRALARMLAKKLGRSYSDVCGYVRSRLSISLVRSVTMLLRSPREGAHKRAPPSWENGEGLMLY